ncbi:hypothetical protein [Lactobacillus hominis]|uniref:Uncharacterized protein n=1 Tax=Lactobacillus hominis DSM 23910 = CRBIP 24.179 TaxID=1423758 RepID=I7JV40_9LACO|nr:hypothetical protein [Lactobacillus hominis]MCT3347826.1 hypothetical protein [Lactobacillus hominis]CCI82171.1 Protein of unknown function [Lactobacillus hominis DSM 23910 = CRBIP 24.179]
MEKQKNLRRIASICTLLWIVFALWWRPQSLFLKAVDFVICMIILIGDIYVIVQAHKYKKNAKK